MANNKFEHMCKRDKLTDSIRILHTPSPFIKNNFIYIQEVGMLKSLSPHICARKELESFLLMIVMDGSGILTVNQKEYRMMQGSIALIDCNESYNHISDTINQWQLAWIHFNGGCSRAFYTLFKENNNCPYVFTHNFNQYVQDVENIMNLHENNTIIAELQIAMNMNDMLSKLIYEVLNEKNKDTIMLENLREVINNRILEKDLLNKIFLEYNFNEEDINEKYKKKFGIDIREYILNRRFTYAKEMLRFSIKPINEIIMDSRIENADLFKHLFLQNEGITAEEYRKKWAQWIRE